MVWNPDQIQLQNEYCGRGTINRQTHRKSNWPTRRKSTMPWYQFTTDVEWGDIQAYPLLWTGQPIMEVTASSATSREWIVSNILLSTRKIEAKVVVAYLKKFGAMNLTTILTMSYKWPEWPLRWRSSVTNRLTRLLSNVLSASLFRRVKRKDAVIFDIKICTNSSGFPLFSRFSL